MPRDERLPQLLSDSWMRHHSGNVNEECLNMPRRDVLLRWVVSGVGRTIEQQSTLHLGHRLEVAASEELVPNVGHRPLDAWFVLGFVGPSRVDQGAVARSQLRVGQVDLPGDTDPV